MEEFVKALLDALAPITASVGKIAEAGSECYGIELTNGDQFFITIEPA